MASEPRLSLDGISPDHEHEVRLGWAVIGALVGHLPLDVVLERTGITCQELEQQLRKKGYIQ